MVPIYTRLGKLVVGSSVANTTVEETCKRNIQAGEPEGPKNYSRRAREHPVNPGILQAL